MASKRLAKANVEMNFDNQIKAAFNSELQEFLGDVKPELEANREAIKELLFKWATTDKPEIKENLEIAVCAYLLKSKRYGEKRALEAFQAFVIKALPIIIKFLKMVIL